MESMERGSGNIEKTRGPRRGLARFMLSVMRVFGILLLLLVVAMVMLKLFINRFIYYPEKGLPLLAQVGLSDVEQVEFLSSDRIKLVSWYLAPKPGMPTLLFFHGNAGNLSFRADRMIQAKQEGWGMLLVGYRGYGQSEGSPDETGLYQDARAALLWIRARPEVDSKKLVYFGESLGCAVALELAVADPPAAMILEAPFSSLRAVAAAHLPWLPNSLLIGRQMDNLERAKAIHCPVLVAHGRDDEVVPFSQGEAVFQALAGPKLFVPLQSHHNDLAVIGGRAYMDAMRKFVTENVP